MHDQLELNQALPWGAELSVSSGLYRNTWYDDRMGAAVHGLYQLHPLHRRRIDPWIEDLAPGRRAIVPGEHLLRLMRDGPGIGGGGLGAPNWQRDDHVAFPYLGR